MVIDGKISTRYTKLSNKIMFFFCLFFFLFFFGGGDSLSCSVSSELRVLRFRFHTVEKQQAIVNCYMRQGFHTSVKVVSNVIEQRLSSDVRLRCSTR